MGKLRDFYKGKTVLITGGSGFMGKVLVEKLLRSCHGLDKLYLLLRNKGVSAESRKEKIFGSAVFQVLLKNKPDILEKVDIVPGDLMMAGMGVSEDDRQKLINEVHVVFHCAASIDFHESLRNSMQMNVGGTQKLLALAKKMKNLESFLHVSTAFSHCNRHRIGEMIYPSPIDPFKLLAAVECFDDDTLEALCVKHLDGRPNTYTLTKALAETLVSVEGVGMPVAVLRPSIVVASYKEPVPGWVDGVNFTTGFIATFGKGVARTMLCNKDVEAEVIPADLAINLMIAAAWETATRSPVACCEDMTVYNCVAGPKRPIKWREVQTMGMQQLWEKPMCTPIWYPGVMLTTSRAQYMFWSGLCHFLPALFVDSLVMLTGRRPPLTRLYHKIYRITDLYSYFVLNKWHFERENCSNLMLKLDDEDRECFRFDTSDFCWTEYLRIYIEGVNKYILKEKLDIDSSRKRFRIMYLIHRLFKMFVYLLSWRLLSLGLRRLKSVNVLLASRNLSLVQWLPPFFKFLTF